MPEHSIFRPVLKCLGILALVTMAGSMTACSSTGEERGDRRDEDRRINLNPFVGESRTERRLDKLTARELYFSGKDALDAGDPKQALELFDALETRHPFTVYATRAQLDSIFAHKQAYEPELALAAANRFLRQHPSHPDIAWVYYIKGVINHERSRDEWERLFRVDSHKRDPVFARLAFEDFGLLIKRFPDSQYAFDAEQRMVFLRNELAKYELNVARYYLKRRAWVGASTRAKHVVEHYQGTTSVAGALDVLVRAYTALGLETQAAEAKAVLDRNFPDYEENRLAAQTEGFLRNLWPWGDKGATPPPEPQLEREPAT